MQPDGSAFCEFLHLTPKCLETPSEADRKIKFEFFEGPKVAQPEGGTYVILTGYVYLVFPKIAEMSRK